MKTDLTLVEQNSNYYIDSREIASLIGKKHEHLLRDIERYSAAEGANSHFVKSAYYERGSRALPCYLLTKIGCQIIANKLNGDKNISLTIAYMSAFRLAEINRSIKQVQKPSLSDCNEAAKIALLQLKAMGASSERIVQLLNNVYEPLGINISDNNEFDEIPATYSARQIAKTLGIYSLYGRPHGMAVSCILNENIFIGAKHKIAICENYMGTYPLCYRYDEYAIDAVDDWLQDNSHPAKIYGFDRTYRVLYSR